ncbi:MAG TPA: hypothetical protein PKC21_02995 [Oligoflexia bacterium]|nr:hypothetical protein [Oligoflexia bacterium]HMR24300.1 hypothetical protein [Oligoflexia bacterium]
MKCFKLSLVIGFVCSFAVFAQDLTISFGARIPNDSLALYISESDIENSNLFDFKCPSDLPLKFLINQIDETQSKFKQSSLFPVCGVYSSSNACNDHLENNDKQHICYKAYAQGLAGMSTIEQLQTPEKYGWEQRFWMPESGDTSGNLYFYYLESDSPYRLPINKGYVIDQDYAEQVFRIIMITQFNNNSLKTIRGSLQAMGSDEQIDFNASETNKNTFTEIKN